MSVKGKLIACGVVAGCIATGVLALNWYLLAGPEGRLWEGSGTPDTAGSYVDFADNLDYSHPVQWRLMRLSGTMREHLEQRRREAAAYEATLPKPAPPLSDSERRIKMRDDYEKSAKSIHLAPAMTAAVLALIDDANARNAAIPFRLTVKNTVQAGGDSDLELALKSDGGQPAFDPDTHCNWDQRMHSEPLHITTLGVDKEGIFITVTLKDLPEPLVLTETVQGASSVRRARRLGATVEVDVVPPQGAPVHATREVSMNGFEISTKVRSGESVSAYSIYTEQIHTLAGNTCFAACTLLGTRDHLPEDPE